MKILLLSAYFPPDTGSASHLFFELGTELVKCGLEVSVITSMPRYYPQGSLERYKGKIRLTEKVNDMDVFRTAIPQPPRRLMIGRAFWQFSGAIAFFLMGLKVPHHDLTVVYSPPLPLGISAWMLRVIKGAPFILNVQDLFPQSIIDLRLVKNKWIIRFFEMMERFVYRRADIITVHSESNKKHVVSKGASSEKIMVIPNWVDTEFIEPADRMNGFRREHGLGDAFVVSFAGILGYSQDLDVVLDAASLLNQENDIAWLIVGDGVEKPRLVTKAKELGLKNVQFLPIQSRDKYPAVLQASDVCLTTLHAKVKTPVVPSKILSIMASGRPVVAALNPDGDAPGLISEAGCGICVPPEDGAALAEAVLKLYRDEALRTELGRNGRRYAEENLSLKKCASLYEKLLSGAMEKRLRK